MAANGGEKVFIARFLSFILLADLSIQTIYAK